MSTTAPDPSASPPRAGVAEAAKTVATDLSALVRAEIDLAKAELAEGAKAKATGAGLLVGAGALGWLALQGLLVTAAIALALVLPAWAAALVVSMVLLLGAIVLVLLARPRLSAPMGIDTAKAQAREDVEWAKHRLRAPETTEQVRADVEWTRAKVTRR